MIRLQNQPISLFILLVSSFLLVLLWRSEAGYSPLKERSLPAAISTENLRLMAAGEEVLLARLLTLWLQNFDTQEGRYVPYAHLDYGHLTDWFESIMELDNNSHYPMLLAVRVYTLTSDKQRKRQMLDFAYQQYQQDPERHWRWLTEAVITAQHGLKDLPLALQYADTLANETRADLPHWARDMRLFIMEDMGQLDELKLIVGGMLSSGLIKDENEIRYLNDYLESLYVKDLQNIKQINK